MNTFFKAADVSDVDPLAQEGNGGSRSREREEIQFYFCSKQSLTELKEIPNVPTPSGGLKGNLFYSMEFNESKKLNIQKGGILKFEMFPAF